MKGAMRKAKAASPGVTPTRQQRQQLGPPQGWENNGPPLEGEWHGFAPPDPPVRSGLGLVICATTRCSLREFKFSQGFPSGSVGKESTCNAGDARYMSWIPGSGSPQKTLMNE